MIALPQYLDREAWEGFVEMRKTIKKPLTVRAAKLVVYELQRIKDAGHDPNASLDQSTNHCWADVYVPKDKTIERAHVETWKPEKYERSKEAANKGLQLLKEAKARIRRVA